MCFFKCMEKNKNIYWINGWGISLTEKEFEGWKKHQKKLKQFKVESEQKKFTNK